jgi:putative polyhydroxyalkanoate system protein
MADIRVTQQHRLAPAEAKAAAQRIVDQMAADYGVQTGWESEDVLLFERSGISGRLILLPSEAVLEIGLSGFMTMFSPMVEEKAARKMKKVFGGPADQNPS